MWSSPRFHFWAPAFLTISAASGNCDWENFFAVQQMICKYRFPFFFLRNQALVAVLMNSVECIVCTPKPRYLVLIPNNSLDEGMGGWLTQTHVCKTGGLRSSTEHKQASAFRNQHTFKRVTGTPVAPSALLKTEVSFSLRRPAVIFCSMAFWKPQLGV